MIGFFVATLVAAGTAAPSASIRLLPVIGKPVTYILTEHVAGPGDSANFSQIVTISIVANADSTYDVAFDDGTSTSRIKAVEGPVSGALSAQGTRTPTILADLNITASLFASKDAALIPGASWTSRTPPFTTGILENGPRGLQSSDVSLAVNASTDGRQIVVSGQSPEPDRFSPPTVTVVKSNARFERGIFVHADGSVLDVLTSNRDVPLFTRTWSIDPKP
jgi:hypothetical protein